MAQSVLGDINQTLSGLIQATATIQNLQLRKQANQRAIEAQARLERATQAKGVLDSAKMINKAETQETLDAIQPLATDNVFLQNLIRAQSSNLAQGQTAFESFGQTPAPTPAPSAPPQATTQALAKKAPTLKQIPQFANDDETRKFLETQGFDVDRLKQLEAEQGSQAVIAEVMPKLRAQGFDTEIQAQVAPGVEPSQEVAPQPITALTPEEFGRPTDREELATQRFLQEQADLEAGGEFTESVTRGGIKRTRGVNVPLAGAARFNAFFQTQRKAAGRNPLDLARVYRSATANGVAIPAPRITQFERGFNEEVNSTFSGLTQGTKLGRQDRNEVLRNVIKATSSRWGGFTSPKHAGQFDIQPVQILKKGNEVLDASGKPLFDKGTVVQIDPNTQELKVITKASDRNKIFKPVINAQTGNQEFVNVNELNPAIHKPVPSGFEFNLEQGADGTLKITGGPPLVGKALRDKQTAKVEETKLAISRLSELSDKVNQASVFDFGVAGKLKGAVNILSGQFFESLPFNERSKIVASVKTVRQKLLRVMSDEKGRYTEADFNRVRDTLADPESFLSTKGEGKNRMNTAMGVVLKGLVLGVGNQAPRAINPAELGLNLGTFRELVLGGFVDRATGETLFRTLFPAKFQELNQ